MTAEGRPRKRNNRDRSPVTAPGYHKGRPAPNKGKTYPPRVFESTDVLKIIRAVSGNGPVHHRHRALFSFLWRTGVRVVELPHIRATDLDEASGYIRIRRPGEKTREVFMFGSRDAPDWGWRQLDPWLERRAALGIVRDQPLFCVAEGDTKGAPVSAASMRAALKVFAKEAKVYGDCRLGTFRNTLAAELHRADISVSQIQKQLGHESLATTQEFLERLGLVETLDDLHDYRPAWRSDDV